MLSINKQKPAKVVKGNGEVLEVYSIFRTIQGEGPLTGRSAVFIRLAGCNLQCPFCDTDYSSSSIKTTTDEVVEEVLRLSGNRRLEEVPSLYRRLIVITGGEPFRQRIWVLVKMLLDRGADVQIETNGTIKPEAMPYYSSQFHIVCSPKTKEIDSIIWRYANAFKYIINHNCVDWETGLPSVALNHPNSAQHVAAPRPNTPVYVQPADMQDEEENRLNLEACIRLVHDFDRILCLQTHKIINLP